MVHSVDVLFNDQNGYGTWNNNNNIVWMGIRNNSCPFYNNNKGDYDE